MNQIKFSHNYHKLTRLLGDKPILSAHLISVCTLNNLKMLPYQFIDFDTSYRSGSNTLHYPLDLDRPYLILTFFDGAKFFTTIRPWNKQKEEYYRGLIGKEFRVVVKEEK